MDGAHNGRIYDSKLGRFLQADPNVQAPDNSQNLNRYSYVLNNPLSYTDPSGFFFKAIGNFVGKYWRQLVAVGIGIVTAGIASGAIWASLTLNSAAAFGVAVAGGALAGYVSTGTLNGALIGAFSAAAFYGVGQYFDDIAQTSGTSSFGKAIADNLRLSKTIAHGMTGGVISKLQGGRFAHGFVSAGVTKAFSKTIAGINAGNDYGNMALQSTAAAVVGGGVSEATGGKFGNGAKSAGFGYLFNQLVSDGFEDNNTVSSSDQDRLDLYAEPGEISEKVDAAIANTTIKDFILGRSGMNVDQANRYIYSRQLGWIDLQHVVSASNNPFTIFGLGDVAGIGVEIGQSFTHPDSAFNIEDLVSNSIGARAGRFFYAAGGSSGNLTQGNVVDSFITFYEPLTSAEAADVLAR